jgi:hypothetical protein
MVAAKNANLVSQMHCLSRNQQLLSWVKPGQVLRVFLYTNVLSLTVFAKLQRWLLFLDEQFPEEQ